MRGRLIHDLLVSAVTRTSKELSSLGTIFNVWSGATDCSVYANVPVIKFIVTSLCLS